MAMVILIFRSYNLKEFHLEFQTENLILFQKCYEITQGCMSQNAPDSHDTIYNALSMVACTFEQTNKKVTC